MGGIGGIGGAGRVHRGLAIGGVQVGLAGSGGGAGL